MLRGGAIAHLTVRNTSHGFRNVIKRLGEFRRELDLVNFGNVDVEVASVFNLGHSFVDSVNPCCYSADSGGESFLLTSCCRQQVQTVP